MADYDCTVIGAGLAGLSLCLDLAKRGRRVLLVDRKPTLTEGIHTTGIFVRRTLESFSLPGDCLGPAIRNVSLYSPSLKAAHLESPFAEFRVGRMKRLYSELLNQCRAAGTVTALDTAFDGLSEADEGSSIHLRTGLRSWMVRSRYLVGADGATSRVAGALCLSRNSKWIVGLEDVYRARPDAGPPRMHCLIDPRLAPGYIAWVVNDGEEVHVGVGGDPRRFRPAEALRLWSSRARSLTSVGERLERRGGRIPVGGVLPQLCNSKGLLIGDAAGAVSPLTAGGLDPCLRLSKLAGDVIDEFLRTGDPAVLSAYAGADLRRKFRKRLWARAALEAVRSPMIAEAACWMLRTSIGQSIAKRVFFQPMSFPDVRLEGTGAVVAST